MLVAGLNCFREKVEVESQEQLKLIVRLLHLCHSWKAVVLQAVGKLPLALPVRLLRIPGPIEALIEALIQSQRVSTAN